MTSQGRGSEVHTTLEHDTRTPARDALIPFTSSAGILVYQALVTGDR